MQKNTKIEIRRAWPF